MIVQPLRGCRKEGNALIPWVYAHALYPHRYAVSPPIRDIATITAFLRPRLAPPALAGLTVRQCFVTELALRPTIPSPLRGSATSPTSATIYRGSVRAARCSRDNGQVHTPPIMASGGHQEGIMRG